MKKTKREYIHYSNTDIYAVYYSRNRTLYINLDYTGTAIIILMR